jgi:glycosyltransferase involved in cell wall biosynthesis
VSTRAETLRLAVLCDLLEERWFSMDLLSDMLLEHAAGTPGITVERVRPTLPAKLGRLATNAGERPIERWSRKLGLGLGRYAGYPLELVRLRDRFDWFHVADHSYAHLSFEIPRGRCGVFCHDIDAFRPLFERPRAALPRRALARTLLLGLRRARVVFHSTLAVRDDILAHRLVPAERLVHAPYGVAPEFVADAGLEDRALGGDRPFLLHVGSLIPRKNPRFLLELAAELLKARPDIEFVQVGGRFDAEQRSLLSSAGVLSRVRQVESLSRAALAPRYRAAKAVLLPSTAEGFGLPIIEALACGTPVIASDIPVLRQVGGDAVVFCPLNDLPAWKRGVEGVLDGSGPDRAACLEAASAYTWQAHARTILGTYLALAKGRA